MEKYKGIKRHEVPPHVFAITDTAYRSMLQGEFFLIFLSKIISIIKIVWLKRGIILRYLIKKCSLRFLRVKNTKWQTNFIASQEFESLIDHIIAYSWVFKNAYIQWAYVYLTVSVRFKRDRFKRMLDLREISLKSSNFKFWFF